MTGGAGILSCVGLEVVAFVKVVDDVREGFTFCIAAWKRAIPWTQREAILDSVNIPFHQNVLHVLVWPGLRDAVHEEAACDVLTTLVTLW